MDRIAFLSTHLGNGGGGITTVVEELSEAMLRLGACIQVFGPEAGQAADFNKSGWRGAPVSIFPTVGPKKLAYSPELTQKLIEWRPDVVHIHGLWQFHGLSARIWHQSSNSPLFISPHGMLNDWAIERSKLKKRISRFLFEDYNFKNASQVHALSAEEEGAISRFAQTQGIFRAPNGIRIPSSRDQLVKQRWAKKKKSKQRNLVYLGRLHSKKGLKELLCAISIIKSSNRLGPWKLMIAGWSQEAHGTELKKLTKTLDITEEIEFIGPIFGTHKEDFLLNKADAFILPSQAEAMPITVLEAWSFGLPVLMTEACNMPEAFAGAAAIKISNQPEAMAAEISDFLGSPDSLRNQIGEQGYKFVKERFGWDKIAEDFILEYQKSIAGLRKKFR